MNMKQDANRIIQAAIRAAQPDAAVQKALSSLPAYNGKLTLIAIGKAAWQMAYAAHAQLGDRITDGVVITKYDHAMGDIGPLVIREAGHPVPDDNTYSATQEAIDLVSGLTEDDMTVSEYFNELAPEKAKKIEAHNGGHVKTEEKPEDTTAVPTESAETEAASEEQK